MDRRKFIKSTCALGLGITGTAILLESCKKSKSVTTHQGPTVNFQLNLNQTANAALNSTGGAVSSNGVIVVNIGGSYTAIAQSCTHNGCNVGYNSSGNNFICPCHNGVFDINGNVTSGPPPAPLKKYVVTKDLAVLTIAG